MARHRLRLGAALAASSRLVRRPPGSRDSVAEVGDFICGKMDGFPPRKKAVESASGGKIDAGSLVFSPVC